jgi:hypothetical protein
LQNLEAKGLIRRNWNHSRSIELTPSAKKTAANMLPLLGAVAAGSPIEAIEHPETVEVPREFVGKKETYVLRVEGDSMIEDGIHDGDLIVVERRPTAQTGETVVALIDDGEATVKRFYREGKDKNPAPTGQQRDEADDLSPGPGADTGRGCRLDAKIPLIAVAAPPGCASAPHRPCARIRPHPCVEIQPWPPAAVPRRCCRLRSGRRSSPQ